MMEIEADLRVLQIVWLVGDKIETERKNNQKKNSRQRNKVSIRKAKISYLNRRLYKPLRSGNSKSFHKYLRICRANGSSVIPHLTYKKETIKIPGQKLIISPEGIFQLLKDLNANKTCGPDNLMGRMLKHFSPCNIPSPFRDLQLLSNNRNSSRYLEISQGTACL